MITTTLDWHIIVVDFIAHQILVRTYCCCEGERERERERERELAG
jgi:hypothetical protein